MSTRSAEVLRLPGAAIPEGCRSWQGESAGRWTRGLPPRWVPVRARTSVFLALPLVAVAGAGLLDRSVGLPAWGAALVALHLVWLVLRPEVALALVPFAAVVVLTLGEFARFGRLGLLAALVGVWVAVCLRLAARKRQRAAFLEAAGGVTAELPRAPGMSGVPETSGGRAERGTFLLWAGLATVTAGGALYATARLWDLTQGRDTVAAASWCLAGLGLTVLLSAGLARRRAVGLRRAPVPVLRVLVRENGDVENEVFAADDVAALRPLFTVSITEVDASTKIEDDDGNDDEAVDEGVRELISRIDDERVGPLREAVLYGAPYDGAEVVFFAAAAKAGEPPVVEVSVGPVRPVTGVAFRWRARAEQGKAVREARQEELRGAAAAAVAERTGQRTALVQVRRWRAGWADWLAVGLALLFLSLYLDGSGWWGHVSGLGATLGASLLLPRRIAWRVTADREGLWFNGLGGARHLAWDHVRAVECEGARLRIHSRQDSFEEWRVASPRWPWLESRIGLVHPYERTAAEITAMWHDLAARPVGLADERQHGRALWPLAAAIGIAGAAVLFLP
ncbi:MULTISPECIES: hypothetical protein [unclassified Streptomyces]|uniref:hypothetical protein n=1 Tax=unclassified Streptomyces TaxID=2593676 RepID=UPI00380A824D